MPTTDRIAGEMSKFIGSPSRARFAPGLILAIVATSVAGIVWQMFASLDSRWELISEGNRALVQASKAMVLAEVRARLAAVEGLAVREDFSGSVSAREPGGTTHHLEELRDLDPELASAAVLDAEGRLWARHPPDRSVHEESFGERDYFREAIRGKGPYLSPAFRQQGSPRALVVAFSMPVRDPSGKVTGVLQSTLPIRVLEQHVRALSVPNHGSIHIVDQNGRFLTQTVGLDTATVDKDLTRSVLNTDFDESEAALPGVSGKRLVAFGRVSDLGWGVLVEQPRSVALRPVAELWTRLGVVGILTLIIGLAATAALSRLIHELDAEQKSISAIVSSAAEAIVTTDTEGTVRAVNPMFERLSGLPGSEVLGKPYHEVLSLIHEGGERIVPEDRPLMKAISQREVIASKGFDLMLVTTKGLRIPVAITAAPILDDDGSLIGGVEVIRDISRESEIDEMKSSLISTVSHELRTPLTMITGFSELLLSREFDPARAKEALEQIHVSSERLGRLIDDLLSVSRIEGGRLAVRPASVDLGTAIREAVEPFSRTRDVRIETEDPLPMAFADPDMLVQVLTNLVSNAVKYSPPVAPVTVRARGQGSEVEISVTDEGIGLSSEEEQALFQKFFRADRPEVREAGGTGLGLFITKSLVELQGGRIWVRSSPGNGSTFTFSIPSVGERIEEKKLSKSS